MTWQIYSFRVSLARCETLSIRTRYTEDGINILQNIYDSVSIEQKCVQKGHIVSPE